MTKLIVNKLKSKLELMFTNFDFMWLLNKCFSTIKKLHIEIEKSIKNINVITIQFSWKFKSIRSWIFVISIVTLISLLLSNSIIFEIHFNVQRYNFFFKTMSRIVRDLTENVVVLTRISNMQINYIHETRFKYALKYSSRRIYDSLLEICFFEMMRSHYFFF